MNTMNEKTWIFSQLFVHYSMLLFIVKKNDYEWTMVTMNEIMK